MNPWDILGWILLTVIALGFIVVTIYFGTAVLAGVLAGIYEAIKENRSNKKKGV